MSRRKSDGFLEQAVVCLHQHLQWKPEVIATVVLATAEQVDDIIERFEAGKLLTTEEHNARSKALVALVEAGWGMARIELAFTTGPRGLTGPRTNGREARRARGDAMETLRVKGWANEEIALVFLCSEGNVRHTLNRRAKMAESEA